MGDGGVDVIECFGDTEVHHSDFATWCDHHVAWLDVSVNDAVLM
ncbi:hypothetical protein GALL_530540 [mine drainage metagenome]|uniref:Uncharacterized protein n=1 Tax=mine drainage metagenome TaxID=410659 RepID=A0A1J5PPA6_9ZZZZ